MFCVEIKVYEAIGGPDARKQTLLLKNDLTEMEGCRLYVITHTLLLMFSDKNIVTTREWCHLAYVRGF